LYSDIHEIMMQKNDPYEIKRARHEQIFRETDITPYVYKRYNFFTLV